MHFSDAKINDINELLVMNNIILDKDINKIDMECLENGIYILVIENEINFKLKFFKK
jgi:hypothetical protein